MKKYLIQFDFNRRALKKHKIKITIAHGIAENISYNSDLNSTSFDRSYIFDKMQGTFIYQDRKFDNIDEL